MRPQPLVSVITIFFNEERFLAEAVESVLEQTLKNWELLLVDDGSSDASSDIAQSFAATHPDRIRYVEHSGHENRGMSASRNVGLRHARGSYVTFLDGDDVFLPDKLDEQAALLEAHPEAAFVCGRAEWWYSWGEAGTSSADVGERSDFIQTIGVPLGMLVEPPAILTAFLRDEWASLCDLMVRTETAVNLGGYVEEFRGMYEDQAFHSKLCLEHDGYASDSRWYRYRQHPEACTSASHADGHTARARLAFLEWLECYLVRRSRRFGSAWRAVQLELLPYRHPRAYAHLSRIRRVLGPVKRLVLGVSSALGASSTPTAEGSR